VVGKFYERQEQRSAEVAVRTTPDASAERAARVQVRKTAQQIAAGVEDWLDVFDPDGLSDATARHAQSYRAELTAYLPEIRSAATLADLNEISAELSAVVIRARDEGVIDAIKRYREAVERQAEMADRQAEMAELAEREAREAERAEREAERRAAVEAQQRKTIQGHAERRAITTGGSQNGYVTAGVMVMSMIEKSRAEKERQLAKHGPCGYEHRKPAIPERRYWITTLDWQGNQSGQELPGAPAAVVCSKHFAMASAWIDEQAVSIARQRGANVEAVYTELT